MPERVNRLLEALSANDLRLKVEVIDHGSTIEGFQKVANRIALGVVLAALIVGAALLMRVQTQFTMFGYPGIAMLLFLAAAAGWVLDGVDDFGRRRQTNSHSVSTDGACWATACDDRPHLSLKALTNR